MSASIVPMAPLIAWRRARRVERAASRGDRVAVERRRRRTRRDEGVPLVGEPLEHLVVVRQIGLGVVEHRELDHVARDRDLVAQVGLATQVHTRFGELGLERLDLLVDLLDPLVQPGVALVAGSSIARRGAMGAGPVDARGAQLDLAAGDAGNALRLDRDLTVLGIGPLRWGRAACVDDLAGDARVDAPRDEDVHTRIEFDRAGVVET